jgi:hypothetical protein
MRRVVAIALVSMSILCMSIGATAQATKKRLAKTQTSASPFAPFVGTWRLVSSVQRMADGTVKPYGFGPRAAGMLMYDAAGSMCVQVMNPDRPQWKDPDHPTGDEVKTAFDGFGGYCGHFTVDTEKHTLTHIPEVSFDPNIAAKPSPRSYSFDGDRLIYEGTDSSEGSESHWTMTWERAQ